MPHTNCKAPIGFDSFGLHKSLYRGIAATGFVEPRPIQCETLPAGLDGYDVLGLAQTGTGKTAAFALTLLHWILEEQRRGPCALVVAPTRELATQIAAEIRNLAKFTKLKTVTIFGGVSATNQVRMLRQDPDIVVGCPGRLLDLLQQGHLTLSRVDTLVIDEADHMFDMGIPARYPQTPGRPARRPARTCCSRPRCPRMSAIWPTSCWTGPHVVELADAAPVATIDHALLPVAERRKRDLLEHVLRHDDCDSAIVFTRTKHRARRLALQLCKAGHRAVALQGNMSQNQRDRALSGFRTRRFDILVATDIAARGIDVSGVSHVINFDVPNTPRSLHPPHRTHRSRRAHGCGLHVRHQCRPELDPGDRTDDRHADPTARSGGIFHGSAGRQRTAPVAVAAEASAVSRGLVSVRLVSSFRAGRAVRDGGPCCYRKLLFVGHSVDEQEANFLSKQSKNY